MSHCPSQDWDRYCKDNDPPETCFCGSENCSENGEWLCKEYPGFCCEACYLNYQQETKACAEAEAEFYFPT